MILCILLAGIAGAVMLWIIRPLIGLRGGLIAEDHAARAEGYKAALKALDADQANALIASAEAGAERAALARALIAEADAPAEPSLSKSMPRWAVMALAALLPLTGLAAYVLTGTTEGRASLMAYQERAETEGLQRKLAEKLKERPADPKGHRFMAMTEAALGHYGAAAHHYSEAIALGERSSELLTLYGEMLALDAGTPTNEVVAAFDEALALEPQNIRARIERAECRFVLGDYAGARDDLTVTLDAVRPETELARMLQARLARAEHMLKSPRAAAQSNDVQAAMINGMVARLAARLQTNPSDLQGWTRLVHSYAVLGEKAKAQDALAHAREAFAGDKSAQAALDNAAQELR